MPERVAFPLSYARPAPASPWRRGHTTLLLVLTAAATAAGLWLARASWAYAQGPPGIRYYFTPGLAAFASGALGLLVGLAVTPLARWLCDSPSAGDPAQPNNDPPPALLTLLSLLLCVAVVVFWARSQLMGDELRRYRPPRIFEVQSNGGLVRVGWGQFDAVDYPPSPGWRGTFWPFERDSDTYESDLRRGTTLGFGHERWVRRTPGPTADVRLITFPYWLPALSLTALPAAAGVRLLVARRAASGTLPALRVRPPRDARAVPGVRRRGPGAGATVTGRARRWSAG